MRILLICLFLLVNNVCYALTAEEFFQAARGWTETLFYITGWVILVFMGVQAAEGQVEFHTILKYLISAGIAFGIAKVIDLLDKATYIPH